MNLKLSEINLHTKAPVDLEIVSIDWTHEVGERLEEMGLHPGMLLTWVGQSPWGGPLILRFTSGLLALRHEEARCIQVKL